MSDRSDEIWSNPELGTRTYYSEDGDDIVLETVQDIGDVIEANKQALNNAAGMRWGDGKIIASIPLIFIYKLIKEGTLSPQWTILDDSAWKRFMNDPDYRHFRTFPGRV